MSPLDEYRAELDNIQASTEFRERLLHVLMLQAQQSVQEPIKMETTIKRHEVSHEG